MQEGGGHIAEGLSWRCFAMSCSGSLMAMPVAVPEGMSSQLLPFADLSREARQLVEQAVTAGAVSVM